jgi:hypothetical protein
LNFIFYFILLTLKRKCHRTQFRVRDHVSAQPRYFNVQSNKRMNKKQMNSGKVSASSEHMSRFNTKCGDTCEKVNSPTSSLPD